MAVLGLNPPPGWPDAATAVLDAYLTRLGARLPAPRRSRARIVAEVADGLIESTDKRVARGVDVTAAARAAVAEFGDPAEVARMFAAELAAGIATRTGRALIGTGPLVGVAWLAAWRQRSGLDWLAQIHALPAAAPLFLLVLGIGVPAALLAARPTRLLAARPTRTVLGWAPGPRRAAGIGVLAGTAAIVGDAALLSGAVLDGTAGSTLGAMAIAASLLRLTAVAAATRRCALLRAASG